MLDGDCMNISCHKFANLISSGLCLGHSKNESVGPKINIHPGHNSFTDLNRFSSRITLHLAPSTFPSALNSFLVPADKKYPHSMMLPSQKVIVGQCVQAGLHCQFSAAHCIFRPKSSVSSDQRIFIQMFAFNSGFLYATLHKYQILG
ncbi:hypothetical protein XENORESO_006138 [Xenotaenia resolanae]|uniref:Uncharacterized protein n=1 Tax=Xenotaenia resolanae TaxID=208358 RepID=A0ABV0VPN3_9TELE